jgi:hypothetical protein
MRASPPRRKSNSRKICQFLVKTLGANLVPNGIGDVPDPRLNSMPSILEEPYKSNVCTHRRIGTPDEKERDFA